MDRKRHREYGAILSVEMGGSHRLREKIMNLLQGLSCVAFSVLLCLSLAFTCSRSSLHGRHEYTIPSAVLRKNAL